MNGTELVALLLVAVVVGSGYSQQHYCSYPSSTELESVIAAIISSGDAAAEPTITLMDFNPVCRSFTDRQDLLRGVSVVVRYTCSGHSNCPSGTAVEQIESGCESGEWSNRVEGSTEPTLIRSQTTEASLSTTAREDCSACASPELTNTLGITTDSVTHCVACNSTCDQGLMRCSGPSASDCCNFYNNSVCVEQCPSPFVSNSDSICVCPEGMTGENCEDFCKEGLVQDEVTKDCREKERSTGDDNQSPNLGVIIACIIGALLLLLLITLLIIGAFIATRKRAKAKLKTAEISLKGIVKDNSLFVSPNDITSDRPEGQTGANGMNIPVADPSGNGTTL